MDCFWTDLVGVEQRCPTPPDVVAPAAYIHAGLSNERQVVFALAFRDKFVRTEDFPYDTWYEDGDFVVPTEAVVTEAYVHKHHPQPGTNCTLPSAWSLPDGSTYEPMAYGESSPPLWDGPNDRWALAPVAGIDAEGMPVPVVFLPVMVGGAGGFWAPWRGSFYTTAQYCESMILAALAAAGESPDPEGYVYYYSIRFVVETDLGIFDWWAFNNNCF